MSPFDPDWAHGPEPSGSLYEDAVWVAALLAIDPVGLGGISIRSWSGPVRDLYLANLKKLYPAAAAFKKMPLHIGDDRMLGGLDLPATLAAGRPVLSKGLIAECDGGILLLAMAERLSAETAARVCAVMDTQIDAQQRPVAFAVIALDEGCDADEAIPAALQERLAFTLAATGLPGDVAWPSAEVIETARQSLPSVQAGDEPLGQICALCEMLGIGSMRAALFALRAARAAAALLGKPAIDNADINLACRLVLAPRATQMPTMPDDAQPEDQTAAEQQASPEQSEPHTEREEPLQDRVADAEKTVLPPALLAALAAGTGPKRLARGAGKSGDKVSLLRGRPRGTRRGDLRGGARLSVLDTLRAAAPWQALRQRDTTGRKLIIRSEDFRIKIYKEAAETVAIFVVDASGSAAVNRLAEAKGAVQLLLAQCYVRRNQVALLAFRGRAAECLLPPTSALARAKRALAALPGGGPTPLATGIQAGRQLAEAEKRKGRAPFLVMLTDGGANIGRDGKAGRAAAAEDALAAAKLCRAAQISAVVVDTSPRRQAFVARLADAMGARYAPLPYADPARLTRIVEQQGGWRASSAA
ncbi:MAG: hypothetical protein B7Z75_08325 [Acidocella sp. 20-57-95]|nr:MAG: hypothetical protein B7Z75_08325 [Acidocella sp. 20-57-95]OYV60542.1 MAG: hypothetical protein B7Z71_06065 [Acidocella sp. 21-58-7]HQT64863.1 magnesium chelatase subunit D [Acidocella sp.]HQU03875.1 magnesium chelatase subunit D [Acidocella sp.]